MTDQTEDWRRLAQYVLRRRTSLGLTQQDVDAAGGPSTATQRLIEGAQQQSFQPRILGRLERALKWAPGSVDAVLAGGEPTPSGENPSPVDSAGAFRAEAEAAWARIKADPRKLRRFLQALPLIEGDREEPPTRDERRSETG